jgi:hypothetical protein
VLADLRDIDAIITDPPYELEYVHLLHDRAALADRIFKPDRIMVVLDGQIYWISHDDVVRLANINIDLPLWIECL